MITDILSAPHSFQPFQRPVCCLHIQTELRICQNQFSLFGNRCIAGNKNLRFGQQQGNMSRRMAWCTDNLAPATPVKAVALMQNNIHWDRLNPAQPLTKLAAESLFLQRQPLLQLLRLP